MIRERLMFVQGHILELEGRAAEASWEDEKARRLTKKARASRDAKSARSASASPTPGRLSVGPAYLEDSKAPRGRARAKHAPSASTRANPTNPAVRVASHAMPLSCREMDAAGQTMGTVQVALPGSMLILVLEILVLEVALFARQPSFRQALTSQAAQHAKKGSTRIPLAVRIA